jgi:hypothetical protein
MIIVGAISTAPIIIFHPSILSANIYLTLKLNKFSSEYYTVVSILLELENIRESGKTQE